MAAKKKSPIIPIIIVIAILALAGLAWFMMKGKSSMMGGSAKGSAFSSIKDALTKSVSLKCEFDENGTHTITYIKNGAIRADMTNPNPEQSGSMIMKEKKMYFWKDKEGYVMEVPDYKDTEEVKDTEKPSQSDDFMKELEAYKDKCNADVVSDSLFNPPSDVTFSDMSQMMPSGMPKVDENGQMNEEEVKKYMQQYQDDSGNTDQ